MADWYAWTASRYGATASSGPFCHKRTMACSSSWSGTGSADWPSADARRATSRESGPCESARGDGGRKCTKETVASKLGIQRCELVGRVQEQGRKRGVEITGNELRPGHAERPLCSKVGAIGQPHCFAQEGGCRCRVAASEQALGGTSQPCCGGLIGATGRPGQMPGVAFRIDGDTGRTSKGEMSEAPILVAGGVVNG
jgi:hypothetical protein